MRPVRPRRIAVLLVTLALIAGGVFITAPYVHGLSFVIRTADMQGSVRKLADFDRGEARERDLAIPTPNGPLRARAYEPIGGHHRAVLLVSGLHPSGIDEPRLVRLTRQLSGNGLAIVTPDIPELSRFEIRPEITDAIERSAVWLASESGLAPDHRVGMMGISFSGGLSIIAAGRPSLAGRVAYVFSFGGHDDVARVLRYLCTGVEPYPPGRVQLRPASPKPGEGGDATNAGGTADQPFVLPPHDYGVAVILLGIADRAVPPAQVAPLRAAVRRYLFASALDTNVDKERAAVEFEALKKLASTLPEPSATLLRYVNDRDVVHLGPRLLPYIGSYAATPGLSVSRSPKPSVPVFLLHGTEDNVIPSIESEYLAEDLRGHAPVRLLLSGLISHAEADRPVHVNDVLQLAGFWGDLLSR
jgi:dienelactone hydrolase